MRSISLFLLTSFSVWLCAQSFSFEQGTIAPFSATHAQLSLVPTVYKDGNTAMLWEWEDASELKVDYAVTHKNFRDGVIFWVYNENPSEQPLRANYRDANNKTQYSFEFGLNFKGWRICRIGSKYMKGTKQTSDNLKLYLLSPQGMSLGRLFIDRFSFVADVNYQNAPDAQQPENNDLQTLIHWNSLWKWESTLMYSQPPMQNLPRTLVEALNKTEQAIATLVPTSANASLINNAKNLFENAAIKRSGDFISGTALVVKADKKSADISFAELGTMMMGMAQDAVFNKNTESHNHFLLLWDYAIDQGFAWGSAMGNNHHYGYETRDIFKATFLMRNELKNAGKLQVAADALGFWSGLAESRANYDVTRDGLVDSWNTLLFERLIAAMLIPAEAQRYRAVRSLVDWTESSLTYTPGNMGGLKPDGSVFHHAGFYPAYAVGGLESLGKFMAAIQPGGFNISTEARRRFSNALFAMSKYTNFKDWTIGIAGRHPHAGNMTKSVVEAFASLALMGGIDHPEDSYDKALAAEFLRLDTENHPLRSKFTGLSPANAPEGFFVMNHGALGIHRVGNSMVTIKGYNSDVWGSEIYTKDNRYGRYQSYGAIEILNGGSPVSRAESRFDENGWDWNRLPGTTTLHLPLQLLESPQTNTLMARSEEDFAGASSLLGQYGVFGMKLKEKNDINNSNFTTDFVARKSVFSFGKRIICIGSDINTKNSDYFTETTLFQNAIQKSNEKISINGNFVEVNNFSFDSGNTQSATLVSDLMGNHYRVSKNNQVKISAGEQISAHNKTKEETRANFLTAYINHGQAPTNAYYEYMIMLKPTPIEQRRWAAEPAYQVLQADKKAHIVYDELSGVTACVSFEKTQPSNGIFKSISAETLLMYQETENGQLTLSVCDPSLHLPVKVKNSESTLQAGKTVQKQLVLEGQLELTAVNESVTVSYQNDQTVLTVDCLLGIPVNFGLRKKTSSVSTLQKYNINILNIHNALVVQGLTNAAALYGSTGQIMQMKKYSSDQKIFNLDKGQFASPQMFVLWVLTADNSNFTQKLIY